MKRRASSKWDRGEPGKTSYSHVPVGFSFLSPRVMGHKHSSPHCPSSIQYVLPPWCTNVSFSCITAKSPITLILWVLQEIAIGHPTQWLNRKRGTNTSPGFWTRGHENRLLPERSVRRRDGSRSSLHAIKHEITSACNILFLLTLFWLTSTHLLCLSWDFITSRKPLVTHGQG